MKILRCVLWFAPYVIAAVYAYGALVHALSMASLGGFPWSEAPLKWRGLDVVYLLLDIAVAIGLYFRRRWGWSAFLIASASQILLYTALRGWLLDVPPEFAPGAEQVGHLNDLILFHLAMLLLAAAYFATAERAR